MNTNKETGRKLLDVRIILAVLWVAGMLSSLNGDTYRLSDPVTLKSMLENTGSIKTTPELLLVMSLIFVGSVFYECLDPDIRVYRESLDKPYCRRTICCGYSCFLGFRFCTAIPRLWDSLVNSTTCVCLTGCLVRVQVAYP